VKLILLIRGVPGSGKTTLAKQLVEKYPDCHHFETDMYFTKNGDYHWKGTELGLAHAWCQQQVQVAMKADSTVIVSNTFTRYWELAPYFVLATANGYQIKVIHCKNQFKNIHGVPELKIKEMMDRFDSNAFVRINAVKNFKTIATKFEFVDYTEQDIKDVDTQPNS
jgi:adenylate kinase family enzyme